MKRNLPLIILFFTPFIGYSANALNAGYYTLKPPFVTNLFDSDGGKGLVQIQIELVAKDKKAIQLLKHHQAPIRHTILMLLSDQTRRGLANPKAREALRKKMLQQLNQFTEREEQAPLIERVLFTKFILKSQ